MNKRVEIFEIERRLRNEDVGGAAAIARTLFPGTYGPDGQLAWEQVEKDATGMFEMASKTGITSAFAVGAALGYVLKEKGWVTRNALLLVQCLTSCARATGDHVCADLATKEVEAMDPRRMSPLMLAIATADVRVASGQVRGDAALTDDGAMAAYRAVRVAMSEKQTLPAQTLMWLVGEVVSRSFRERTHEGFLRAVEVGTHMLEVVREDLPPVMRLHSNMANCKTMLSVSTPGRREELLTQAVEHRVEALRMAQVLGDGGVVDLMERKLADARARSAQGAGKVRPGRSRAGRAWPRTDGGRVRREARL